MVCCAIWYFFHMCFDDSPYKQYTQDPDRHDSSRPSHNPPKAWSQGSTTTPTTTPPSSASLKRNSTTATTTTPQPPTQLQLRSPSTSGKAWVENREHAATAAIGTVALRPPPPTHLVSPSPVGSQLPLPLPHQHRHQQQQQMAGRAALPQHQQQPRLETNLGLELVSMQPALIMDSMDGALVSSSSSPLSPSTLAYSPASPRSVFTPTSPTSPKTPVTPMTPTFRGTSLPASPSAATAAAGPKRLLPPHELTPGHAKPKRDSLEITPIP